MFLLCKHVRLTPVLNKLMMMMMMMMMIWADFHPPRRRSRRVGTAFSRFC